MSTESHAPDLSFERSGFHLEDMRRQLERTEPVIVGLKDVAKGGILPEGWKIDPADMADAVREERDDT